MSVGLQSVAFGGVFAPLTQMHAVYPPIWHTTFVTCHYTSLSSFLSVKDGEEQKKKQGAEQQTSKAVLLVSNMNGVYSYAKHGHAAGISTCCLCHLRDKQEESCGGAGNNLPTPSPSGQGAFYIPPLISITIAVTGPHARHIGAGRRTYARSLTEEPAAADEEADARRYERPSQSSAAK